MQNIPLADLYLQYSSIKEEIDTAIAAVIRDSAFIRGPYVEKFEADFAEAAGVAHCVSCANGTDALYIAMVGMGVRPGDQVITSAHSWIGTSAMITRAGGSVVFCDTDDCTFTIDPRTIAQLITPRTVGIIPVHLYGQPADMNGIQALAERHGLWVIEDCAQAHLAHLNGRPTGSFGIAAAYSFYPGKNLGAFGDAGAIVTGDASLARRMARFARHGGLAKNEHTVEGINSRLDGLQAAILSAKLPHLARWTTVRQATAIKYGEALAHVDEIQLPFVGAGRGHVYHNYVIKSRRRDELAIYLKNNGVQTAIHYPVALPFLSAYERLGHRAEEFPNAYRNQNEILSLPIFPEITIEQQRRITDLLQSFGRVA